MPLANFDGFLVEGTPCQTEDANVFVYGMALEKSDRTDVVRTVMNFGNDARLHFDLSGIVELMNEGLSRQALAGPTLAIWAIQECVEHGSNKPRKEHLGSWFLPTMSDYEDYTLPVTKEDNMWIMPWEADAALVGQADDPETQQHISGMVLPRAPAIDRISSIAEAILLARVGDQNVYGFLHRLHSENSGSIEGVIPPAAPGQARRPRAGKLITLSKPLV